MTLVDTEAQKSIVLTKCETLIHPCRVYSRPEILEKPCPVPKVSGLYAWYFKEIPPEIPIEHCRKYEDMTLLYIGISPKSPPKREGAKTQTLRTRIRSHYKGNAEG